MTSRVLAVSALAAAIAVISPARAAGQLRLPVLFGDGMVLQRGEPVPVWGWAKAGDAVTVAFNGHRYATQADPQGRWQVRLPATPAGGPYTLEVTGPDGSKTLKDVLVGDVWICSGQSNMEFEVASARNAAAEIAAANDPRIRQLKVPRSWAEKPEDDLAGGTWVPATPEYVPAFTAVGYFFARELRKHVDVPIGLINTTWGGTRIEPWTSAAGLHLDSAALATLLAGQRAAAQKIRDNLAAKIGSLPDQDAGLVNGEARWADPGLDETTWATIQVPGQWEPQGYDGLDGVAWYRTSVDLTADEAAAGAKLALSMIDDNDQSWVNGQKVGETVGWNRPRLYEVQASALHAGRNVIAVRVEDFGQGGGIYGDSAQLYLETRITKHRLAGTWRFRVGQVTVAVDAQKMTVPTYLYNKMIHPLQGFPVKGVLWYQGEANADRPGDAIAYRKQLPAMIQDWRAGWKRPQLPFFWIQLPNFQQPAADPNAVSNWALLRESQTAALALPKTGQVVTIDLGEADDIHPKDKQDVGLRLAAVVRDVVHGDGVPDSGPTYRSHQIARDRIAVWFSHAAGLKTKDGGPVKGFAIAGPDRKWVWADATIQGDQVVVSSQQVPNPVAVRYAWADNPDRANLYNAADLPATPFRTDDW